MEIDQRFGTDGVVRFPVERRAKPTLALVEELAPRPDLADAMADERAGGEDRPDTLVQVVDAFTTLAETLEFSMGAEAAAEQAELQLRNAKVAGYDGLLGELHEQVRRSRSVWTACALTARAAADAARGAKEALDCHESGEPWRRRTGNENGLLLLELKDTLDARRRERKGEPV